MRTVGDWYFRKTARLLCGLVVGLNAVLVTVPALAKSTTLFILDGSASMSQRLKGGKRKIDAAREAMRDILSKLPNDTVVGLITYRGCADIELTVAPAPGNAPAIVEALELITPGDGTPIADSLVVAGAQLKTLSDEASVVLVSDGNETCGGDPCAVAETLHARHIGLKFHIVGYDVDADARKQLRCVAERGGGRYYQTDNIAGLIETLTVIGATVAAESQSPAAGGTMNDFKLWVGSSMDSFLTQLVIAIIAASFVGFLGFIFGIMRTKRRYITNDEAALSRFLKSLNNAIYLNSENHIIKATAIVSIRNSVRKNIQQVDHLLNSDIDVLSSLLKEAEEIRAGGRTVPHSLVSRIKDRIDVLKVTWPEKEPQVDVALRKFLAELGLERFRN